MKRTTFILLIGFALMILAGGCSGMHGSSSSESGSFPFVGGAITNVGNPTDETEAPKADYVNETYGVKITYPGSWALIEQGDAEADFSSDSGVQLTASFVELSKDESFDSFLNDVRGGRDGLVEKKADGFGMGLCAPKASNDAGLDSMECYYFRDDGSQKIVLAVTGVTTEDVFVISLHMDKKIQYEDIHENPLKTLHWVK